MKTIWMAAAVLAMLVASEARAQEFRYSPPFQNFGNYAPTMYANSGRPSLRSGAQYRAMRPVMPGPIVSGYSVAPSYALPGTYRYYPRVTSYYQGQAPLVAAPGAYGYDYQMRPPADWFNGYWGW